MPRNIVGPPVQGSDFFGRDDFVRRIEEHIARRQSVLLSAPRRWGKTSVLRTVRNRDTTRRHYFDLYAVRRAPDFVAEVALTTATPLRRVAGWIGQVLGQSLERVDEIRLGDVAVGLRERLAESRTWTDQARGLFASLPADHVLIFDEFPVMVKTIYDRDPEEAQALLHWLRAERQATDRPVQVLAGSTSLTEVCRQGQMSDAVNDLAPLPLPPFDRGLALQLVRSIFETEGIMYDEQCAQTVIDLVGPEVPFFLQLLVQAVVAELRDSRPGGPCTPDVVRRAYREGLLGPDYRALLDDFRGRMDRVYLPAEREVALIVLDGVARSDTGLALHALREALVTAGKDERLLERVLTLMEGDFYVKRRQDGSYGFFNAFLAEWWRRFQIGLHPA